jgi:glutamine amidotransferase
MKKIAILDYGAGNIHSVYSAFSKVSSHKISIISQLSQLAKTDYLVLPGVGAYEKPMKFFASNPEFKSFLLDHIKSGKPFLGICVGMQILADQGWENGLKEGLGLIAGEVKKFSSKLKVRIPHMGWNNILLKRDIDSKFNLEQFAEKDFYFVHSYYFSCKNDNNVIAECSYGNLFPAIIADNNVIATQFHPEKSGVNGLNFINEYLKL